MSGLAAWGVQRPMAELEASDLHLAGIEASDPHMAGGGLGKKSPCQMLQCCTPVCCWTKERWSWETGVVVITLLNRSCTNAEGDRIEEEKSHSKPAAEDLTV